MSGLPVIIGAALATGAQSVSAAERQPSDPIELMATAVSLAARNTGVPDVLTQVDLTAVVGGLWSYRDPGWLIAQHLGVDPGRTLLTEFGGQIPVQLCAEVAARIERGEVDVAVIVGGECTASRRAAKRTGTPLTKPVEQRTAPDEVWGEALDMGDAEAVALGADQPRHLYAILDSALRAARHETLDAGRDRAAAICAAYAQVAATNPHAASPTAITAAEIREPSSSNRMVSWPYTKAMCANNTVDHAGAIIMCSASAADRLGVEPGRRTYPHVFSEGFDTELLADRYDLAKAPGLEATCSALLDAIGGVEQLDHLDLYCCYPSMVTMTVAALGLDLETELGRGRPLTVTGGLGFAGAPINFAAGEGLIAMHQRLVADPGTIGLVQANGGIASKHAFVALSTTPPSGACHFLQNGKHGPARMLAPPDSIRSGTIDGITVEWTPAGPQRVIALVRLGDGRRMWANSTDPAVMRSATETEWVGRPAGQL